MGGLVRTQHVCTYKEEDPRSTCPIYRHVRIACIRIYVYIRIYVCIRIYMHTYVYEYDTCIPACIHACMHTYIHHTYRRIHGARGPSTRRALRGWFLRWISGWRTRPSSTSCQVSLVVFNFFNMFNISLHRLLSRFNMNLFKMLHTSLNILPSKFS